jgi:hypothetical protein
VPRATAALADPLSACAPSGIKRSCTPRPANGPAREI